LRNPQLPGSPKSGKPAYTTDTKGHLDQPC